MTNPQLFFDQCMAELAKEDLVLDVGGGRPFQKYLAPYEPILTGKLKSLDKDPDTNPDIVGNADNLPFKDGEVGGVICIALLEHVEDPFKVVSEIHRVLKPKGPAFIYIPFLHPYHGNERFEDYWRFTKQGCELMFNQFQSIQIVPNGGFNGVFRMMLPGKLRFIRVVAIPLLWLLEHTTKYGRTATCGYYIFLRK